MDSKELVHSARTRPRRRTAIREHLSPAANLLLWETLIALTVNISLRTFRALMVLGTILVGVLAAALCGFTMPLLLTGTGSTAPQIASDVQAVVVLLAEYLLVVDLFRASMGDNRIIESQGRAAVLRMWDVNPRAYLYVWVFLPRTPRAVISLAVLVPVIAAIHPYLNGSEKLTAWLLLLLPAYVAVAPGVLSVILVQHRYSFLRRASAIGTLILAGGLGASAGLIFDHLSLRLSLQSATTFDFDIVGSVLLGVTVVLTAVALSFMVRTSRRTAASGDVDLLAVEGHVVMAGSWLIEIVALRGRNILSGAMFREFLGSAAWRTYTRVVVAFGAVALAGLGWHLTHGKVEIPALLQNVFIAGLTTTMIAIGDCVSRSASASRFSRQIRFLYESGAGGLGLCWQTIHFYSMVGLPVAVSGLVLSIFIGLPYGSAMCIVGLILMPGALLTSECLVPVVRAVDGSTVANVLGGMAFLALMAPLPLSFIVGDRFLGLLALFFYSCAVVGGGILCPSWRMRVMASSYAT